MIFLCFYNSVAFVLPSLSESWGLVVNEAMAAGLPILISNKINASNALLRDGFNGFSFEPLHFANIAEKIMAFINLDLEGKGSMSNNSLKIIGRMDYENMEMNYLQLIVKISKIKQSVYGPGFIAYKYMAWRYNTAGWNKL